MVDGSMQFPNRDDEAQLNEVVAPRLEKICHQPLPWTCLNLHGRSIPCRPDTLPAGGFLLVGHYDVLPRTTTPRPNPAWLRHTRSPSLTAFNNRSEEEWGAIRHETVRLHVLELLVRTTTTCLGYAIGDAIGDARLRAAIRVD